MPAKYKRLANTLKAQLLQNTGSGIYKLPSEQALCDQYQVSRQTVRAALHLLSEEGLIEKRQGSGSFSTGLGSMENTIGILVNNADEYTMPAVLADIKSALREKGYSTNIYSTHAKISTEREILESLKASSIRGLIVEGTKTALPNPNLDLYRNFMAKGVCVLFLGGNYPGFPTPVCIKDDDYHGGYLLAKHLIQRGHTQIAGIFKIDDTRGLERYSGYATALRDYGVAFSDDLVAWYDAARLEALEARSDTGFLTSFLRRNRNLFTAAICQNDEIAYWFIKEVSYAGIRIPEDISVVSFDNSYLSDASAIRITSLAHKNHEVGTAAATALLNMIQGAPVYSTELSWHLIPKGSDAPYPTAALETARRP